MFSTRKANTSRRVKTKSAVDRVLQALAGRELRYIASSDVDLSARRRVTALRGCTVRNSEAAETGEANVAALLQFSLDGLENSVNSGSSVSLRDTGLLGHCGHELILVHVSTPFSGMKRLISKRGANRNALTRRNPKNPANQGKASVARRFSQKKTGKIAGLFAISGNSTELRRRASMCDRRTHVINAFNRCDHGRFDGAIPFDRFRPADERVLDDFAHARDRNDLHAVLHVVRNLRQILGVFFRDQHLLDAAAHRCEQLFLQAADRQHAAAQRDFTGHGDILGNRDAGHDRDDRGCHGDTGRGTILRRCAFRQVHMDVALVEARRLDAEIDSTRADVGGRGGDRFLHDFLQVAGNRHAALARHHHAFDRQQHAADFRPGETGDNTDLIFAFGFAMAVARHAEIVGDVLGSHGDRLGLALDDLGDRLAGELHQFALEVTDTGFAGVLLDNDHQSFIADREFARLQCMLLDGLRQQVPLGDFALFVFGVAGDTDDLHAVHQGRRDVQRVRRRDEHDVRQVIFDFQVVVHESRVLRRVQHFQQSRRRIAAVVHAELVDFVEQEQRIGLLGLLHRLDDLAGHRADIGAAVTADLGFVTNAAKRHADILTAGRLGDRLSERGLADARRADEAQDRALDLGGACLDGQIFDDAFLDLVEAEMIRFEDLLGIAQICLDLRLLVPGNTQQPIEIVAHDGRFSRHRAHLPKLLQLGIGLFLRFLRQLGLGDALFQFSHLVAAFIAVAELLLDRLHLLVQIVFALGLLHLALDARADALFDLQDRDLTFHEAERLFQPALDAGGFQHLLLFGDLDRQMRRDRIGELGIVVDLAGGADHFRRNLLVELHVALKFRNDGAAQRLELDLIFFRLMQNVTKRFVEILAAGIFINLCARTAFDQHLDGAVGQLQQLQNIGYGADLMDCVRRRIIIAGIDLGDQHDLLVRTHDFFQRPNGLLPSDEQRHDHVGEDHDVAQRQYRIGNALICRRRFLSHFISFPSSRSRALCRLGGLAGSLTW
ncbi:hypothetical protein RHSP_17182 [Rhizobium freirei PRF 81]|uniref:NAD-specific glutamate dehydrogenase n=1 Tax=Rhizobium freirei PRF 81 TaxID=363754 RepID=N6UYT1_9HYPH|nr:hypothetical protein RHSP_17182 [Rhizobium freirei PRF 81]